MASTRNFKALMNRILSYNGWKFVDYVQYSSAWFTKLEFDNFLTALVTVNLSPQEIL